MSGEPWRFAVAKRWDPWRFAVAKRWDPEVPPC